MRIGVDSLHRGVVVIDIAYRYRMGCKLRIRPGNIELALENERKKIGVTYNAVSYNVCSCAKTLYPLACIQRIVVG